MHEDLTRALELREQGKGDSVVYVIHNRLGEPCPQCGTPDRARRLRGAHDLLLPELPDGRSPAQGPPAVTSLALRTRCYGGRVADGVKLADDLQASSPEIALALSRAGVSRSAEGGPHPPRQRRDGDGCGDRLHGRPRRRPEGRPHVALPRALRGGDRARRRARGAPRRGARRAHREPRRRAPGRAPCRGLDPRAMADPPPHAGDESRDAGDGDAVRHRRGVRERNAARRRRRGDRDQRLPVRARARAQPRLRAAARGGVRRRRRREDPRARPDRDAQPARARRRCSSAPSRISTRRCSSTSPSAR